MRCLEGFERDAEAEVKWGGRERGGRSPGRCFFYRSRSFVKQYAKGAVHAGRGGGVVRAV